MGARAEALPIPARYKGRSLHLKSIISAFLSLEEPVPEALVCPLPHTLWPWRKRCAPVGRAAEAPLDVADAAHGPGKSIFLLARVGEVVAAPAPVKAAAAIELHDAPTAPADKIRPPPAEVARDAVDVDVLGHGVPIAVGVAHPNLDRGFTGQGCWEVVATVELVDIEHLARVNAGASARSAH
jgi:hypothetical protein